MTPREIRIWFAQIFGLPDQPLTTVAMQMAEDSGKVLGYMRPDGDTNYADVFDSQKRRIGSLIYDLKWNVCYILSKNDRLLNDTVGRGTSLKFRFGFPLWLAPHDFIFCRVHHDLERFTEAEILGYE